MNTNRAFQRYRELRDRIATLASSNHTSAKKRQERNEKKVGYIPSVSQESFEKSVRKIQEYIAAGDIFQAVLSRRIECAVSRPLRDICSTP